MVAWTVPHTCNSISSAELLGHHEVPAAVLLPAFLVAFHARWLFLAVADGADPVCADSQTDQVLLDRRGAAIAQRQVVFRGTAFIAMAFDHNFDLRIVTQKIRGLGQRGSSVGTEVGFVEIKVSIAHLFQEHLLECCVVLDYRGRRCRRIYTDSY